LKSRLDRAFPLSGVETPYLFEDGYRSAGSAAPPKKSEFFRSLFILMTLVFSRLLLSIAGQWYR
jgi:hypothetical protein